MKLDVSYEPECDMYVIKATDQYMLSVTVLLSESQLCDLKRQIDMSILEKAHSGESEL